MSCHHYTHGRSPLFSLHHDLASVEGFRESVRRAAFRAPQTRQTHEGLRVEPVLRALRAEMVVEELGLALHQRPAGRDEDVRLTQIAVPFRNLVFEDRMIAKSVPGQHGYFSMIL